MSSAPVCLIDASIYIFRYYFSLPDRWFSTPEGFGTAAVYGYTGFLLSLLEAEAPGKIAACFDESLGSGFRHQLSPTYKSSRVLPDQALAFQLNACREVTRLLGVADFASVTHEADDLLGSLYRICSKQSEPVAILTRDKDLSQLLARPCDFLWDYNISKSVNKGVSKRAYADDIQLKFGVRPDQFVDYLALVGDAGDDIPGVPGVGPKTAAALLQACGEWETIRREPERVAQIAVRGASGLATRLAAYADQVDLSVQLARIVTDLSLIDDATELAPRGINLDEFSHFCTAMGWSQAWLKRARALSAR